MLKLRDKMIVEILLFF